MNDVAEEEEAHVATVQYFRPLQVAILPLPSILFWKLDSEGLGLTEKRAGIDAQVLGCGRAIAMLTAKGVGNEKPFHGL